MKTLPRILTSLLATASLSVAQVPQMINYQGRVVVDGTNFDGTGQFKFSLVDGGTTTTPLASTATATGQVVNGFLVDCGVTDGGAGYDTAPAVTITDPTGSGATATASVSGGSVTSITVGNPGSGYSANPTVTIAAPPAPTPTTSFVTLWSNDGTGTDGEPPSAAVSLPVQKGLYSVLLGDPAVSNMTVVSSAVFTNSDVRLRVWFDDGAHGWQRLDPDQRIAAVGYAMMAGTAQTVPDGAITSDKIAPGAVGTIHLGAGAVGAANIATGSITGDLIAPGTIGASNIAAGAIGAAELAKSPQSGSIPSSSLTGEFGDFGSFSATFSPLMHAAPIVNLFLSSSDPALLNRATLSLLGATTGGFSGRANLGDYLIRVDSNWSSGAWNSLGVIDGNPAMCYQASSTADLKYVRAVDSDGKAWSAPITVVSSGDVGWYCSLAVASGNPAISYWDKGAQDLMFVRASDSTGASWGTPVAVDTNGNVGLEASLAVVGGNPAICYYDQTRGALRYVRANDPSGATWATPVSITTNAGIDSTYYVGRTICLAVVNGNPAASFVSPGYRDLMYVRANDSLGASWPSPILVDAITAATNVGHGWATCLRIVNGNPAISYLDSYNYDLKYIRANDSAGTSWAAPLTVAANGTVGLWSWLEVVEGRPAISHLSWLDGQVRYIRASDDSGTSWGQSVTAVTSQAGWWTSLSTVNGRPAIATPVQNFPSFIRAPTASPFNINWIAIEP